MAPHHRQAPDATSGKGATAVAARQHVNRYGLGVLVVRLGIGLVGEGGVLGLVEVVGLGLAVGLAGAGEGCSPQARRSKLDRV